MTEDVMQQALRVPDDVLWQRLPDGESVFLNLRTEEYFGLDATGTEMWEVLSSSATLGDARGRLLAIYDTTPDVIERDLLGLVDRLVARGLLAVGAP
ncbi:MAG TPA: PqqD family protein [Egibacteraceae bacterium]|nr:PqqD family protein [Egibacteraceae bacterium]